MDLPRLDHDYTVFAVVTSGLDVMDQILEGVGGIGNTTLTGYELSALTGINAARVVQLVSRITW